ncbi:hypothetical protein, partial [Salmonella enterica]|uniref:hypothetical protein n=1 Tax=Salmonella enterica TaxID=28901 RepID=UPI001E529AD4
LFIVGDLRSNPEKPEWRFHVTAMVKSKTPSGEEQWYAVDPIFPKAIKIQDWITQVKAVWDYKNAAYLYRVSPDVILPDLSL